MLEVSNLSCVRSERCLWQNIAFKLTPGKLLQVIGNNGAGKTSLLRIIAGLARAHSGTVTWQGTPISRQGWYYQQQVFFLGHVPAVKAELTVQENLRLSLSKTNCGDFSSVIGQVGLANHTDHYGYQLSQGQKQRVAIANMLLSRAALWILDEPAAGLDTQMMAQLETIFNNKLDRGGIILLTTHRPLTALTTDFLRLPC